MIRFLQRQKAKKGFTMIELIVVIAIIAVMIAMILPMLSAERSRKQEANSAARDFYTAMQTVMTKYSMYEGPLSPKFEKDAEYGEMRYYQKMGGNYPIKRGVTPGDTPVTASLYVEVTVEKNRVKDIYTYVTDESDSGYATGEGFYTLCKRESNTKNNIFGNLLKAEIAERIHYQDGNYYAKVTYKNILDDSIPAKMEAETVKVEYTGFSRKPVPSGSNFTDFLNKNMSFGSQDNKLVNGEIFGVCAPLNPDTGKVMGWAGTKLS